MYNDALTAAVGSAKCSGLESAVDKLNDNLTYQYRNILGEMVSTS
jgi:hypothetical protein